MPNDEDKRTEPRISVIVVGRDGMPSLVPILACLSEQTIAREIELIAVLPKRADFEEDLERWKKTFHSVHAVCVPAIRNRGFAAAPGVRVARAPWLAFTENHCFPDPNWAERLCASQSTEYVGVAPAVLNANPETNLSWAIYGAGYAVFTGGDDPEEMSEMPLHNTSYRREALVAFDNELEDLLEHEGKIQARLIEQGGRFLLNPAARTRHVNEATWQLVLGLNFFNGWRFGGRRGAEWTVLRRLVYTMLFPLLSLNLMRETLRRLKRCRPPPPLTFRLRAVIWIQSLAHAAGEAVGYLSGRRDTFPFVDLEEFMVLERLGDHPLSDPRLASFVALAVPVDGRAMSDEIDENP